MGQSDFDLSIETRTGYEYNVFNANKDKIIIRNEVSESALKSGYFQNLSLAASWSVKSKHHSFRMSGKLQKDFFPQLRVADLFRPYAKLKYTLRLNKNHEFSLSARHSRYRTNRLENEEEVLRPPRAYDRSSASAKYSMKLFSGNSIYAQTSLRHNAYVTDVNRDFFYNSMRNTISLSQRMFSHGKYSHSLRVKAEYAIRLYSDSSLNSATEEEAVKEREWKYYEILGEYIWSVKKRFKLTIGMNAEDRQDILQDKYGYRQYKPYLKIDLKGSKVDFSIKGSAARRTFHTLKAQTNFEEVLIHDYLRASMELTWKVTKKLRISLEAAAVSRSRNLSEGARSFLAYDNAILSLGIKYNVF